MRMNWIFLSLLGPLFWTASNFIDKYVLGKHSKGIFDFLFFSTITSWLFFVIILLFNGLPVFSIYHLIPIATGIILIYSYGFYAKALEQGETSALVILFKLIPVVTLILGFIFLGQTLSKNELWGFAIVFIGTLIVSFEKTERKLIKGFGMIIIAILLWSILTLMIDYGLTKMTFWDYFVFDTLGSGLAGLALFIIPKIRKEVLTGIKTAKINKYLWYTGNNIFDFAGQMCAKGALAIAPSAALVVVVNQAQSFYAIIIGALLTVFIPSSFKENIKADALIKKIIGAVIMFFGVYLLLV